MKGYTPPPRMVVSNEPMPITRNITITEGISVKDLAEKLDIRVKDVISRLLGRGVFATVNQTLDAELCGRRAEQVQHQPTIAPVVAQHAEILLGNEILLRLTRLIDRLEHTPQFRTE
jgi:translation initiation factor IF-2